MPGSDEKRIKELEAQLKHLQNKIRVEELKKEIAELEVVLDEKIKELEKLQ